ncbi:response regulator [Sphingomonas sp. H39-1-10]|uniref:response regulator n=1 Tax=Sphingomonas TaxID=13687 RepID=UPI000883D4F8|nr:MULTISPECIES: response regulator [Sphingomonas]MDF0490195.1 response regulator [Sphingomonas pollutisoli]SDA17612.1 Response regulator receiver domain-containing protein [Sphingomonas sp. NFR15]
MTAPSLEGCSVLVLEDDFYLADDIAEALRRAGARVLGPFANAAGALASLRGARPDLAVLDVNLGAETSIEVGRGLRGDGVPILFATGYDASALPPDLADAAYLPKPVNMTALVSRLRDLRGERQTLPLRTP